jgi:DNA ligase (NAD+)
MYAPFVLFRLSLRGTDYPEVFEIRGEIVMPFQVFEELNKQREEAGEPLFANPRNAAAGTLKMQNPAVVASRKLDAYFYSLMGDNLPADGHYENLKKASEWGFKISMPHNCAAIWMKFLNTCTNGIWNAIKFRWLLTGW